MRCTNCNSPMGQNDKFCSRCGAPNPMLNTDAGADPENRKTLTIVLCCIIAVAACAAAILLAVFIRTVRLDDTDTGSKVAAADKDRSEREEPEASDDDDDDETDREEIKDSKLGDVGQAELHYSSDVQREFSRAFSEVAPESLYDTGFIPESTALRPETGLGNVVQIDRFNLSDRQKEMLENKGFFVTDMGGSEYFEEYEFNRYWHYANFVTADSMLHTYHLYFQHLLKSTERQYLLDELSRFTNNMLSKSIEQYNILRTDSRWEEAAYRNVAFFSVASRLLSDKAVIPEAVTEAVNAELELINGASGTADSHVTGNSEDYSQYKPRGYYDGDEDLERYFRTMMWYGRMNFRQNAESMNRSALLMTLAMNDEACYESWETVYAITSFFAGESDDLSYCEYWPAAKEAYGEAVQPQDLIGNEDSWVRFCELTSVLEPPRINSLPGKTAEESFDDTKGFRVMGQRFSIDAEIFQQLVYSQLAGSADGERRTLPDALDIPAALGSDEALEILKGDGIERFAEYVPKVEKLRTVYSGDDTELWRTSLYSQWLYALRPLLDEKKDGYPWFMTCREWARKDLETFLGSYTELKHDTILYSKQVMAEGDGEPIVDFDDRGYVEPEYKVYACITALVKNTKSGLMKYGALSERDAENLDRLSSLSGALITISEKELKNEILTDDEYDLIRNYGTYLSEFWHDVMSMDTGEEYPGTQQHPAAIIADVASDGRECLEAATGNPSLVYAVAPVAGELKLVKGTVYSFYQFSSSERLTDSQWRQMMGLELNERGEYDTSRKKDHAPWSDCYRANRW